MKEAYSIVVFMEKYLVAEAALQNMILVSSKKEYYFKISQGDTYLCKMFPCVIFVWQWLKCQRHIENKQNSQI